MMQERASTRMNRNLIPMPHDLQRCHRFYRRFSLTQGGPKGGKIVPTDQDLRRIVHSVSIERVCYMPDLTLAEGRRWAAIEDAIPVDPANGRKSRMKIIRHFISG